MVAAVEAVQPQTHVQVWHDTLQPHRLNDQKAFPRHAPLHEAVQQEHCAGRDHCRRGWVSSVYTYVIVTRYTRHATIIV